MYQARLTHQLMGDGNNWSEISTVFSDDCGKIATWAKKEAKRYARDMGYKLSSSVMLTEDVTETTYYRWVAVARDSVHRVYVITAAISEVQVI